jgi:hypothetical protein
MRTVDTYIKSVLAALIAGLGAFQTAVADNSGVTSGEWATIAVAVIAALGLVYAIPNAGTLGDGSNTTVAPADVADPNPPVNQV